MDPDDPEYQRNQDHFYVQFMKEVNKEQKKAERVKKRLVVAEPHHVPYQVITVATRLQTSVDVYIRVG